MNKNPTESGASAEGDAKVYEFERIDLAHTQTPQDTAVLTALARRLLGTGRIVLWAIMSGGLTLLLSLAADEGNRAYVIPLALLSGLMTLAALALLVYALSSKPKLLAHIQANEGKRASFSFLPHGMILTQEGREPQTMDYSSLLGQYWLDERYILHLRPGKKEGGHGDELLCIPLTRNTFDLVYALAAALEEKKKRLTRIRVKASRP